MKLTTVSSLELIQESVSCCLLRPLLTTTAKLQLPNGVLTIEKIWPCGQIVKTNSQVQRTTGRSVIASLQSEGELKTTLCNIVRELRVTLEQIK